MAGKLVDRLKMPAGALPGNVVQKAGIGAITVLIVGLVLSSMMTDGGGEDGGPLVGTEARPTGEGQVARLDARLSDLQEEQQRQQEREARRERAESGIAALDGPIEGVAAAGAMGMPVVAAGEGVRAAAAGAGAGEVPAPPLTADEVDLRERLRLEGVERRARSLRAPAVVQSTREASARPPLLAGEGQAPADGGPPAMEASVGQGYPMPDTGALIQQIQDAAMAAAQLSGEGEAERAPWERSVPGVTGPAVEPAAEPVSVSLPDDPPGMERVYEGSMLSAVLVTQLSGEFAGPVSAQVSIPFYSADRQRILIPRGARLLGTAQAVQDRDQSRLAVGFHRLLWPDGRWVDLSFHGMNALGEGALVDQVNRHYWSMFAAAGAVGVISGLTLQGANPYGGGIAGFQAGTSQGLGQSATQILERFLNRFPTITIRAGHRLRVWVTSDFLVPRPVPAAARMFR